MLICLSSGIVKDLQNRLQELQFSQQLLSLVCRTPLTSLTSTPLTLTTFTCLQTIALSQELPSAFRGTWVGEFFAPFGFTDLSKEDSWECTFGPLDLPQPLVTVVDNSLELTENRLILGPWPETSVTSPPFTKDGMTRTWSWPAETVYDEIIIVSYNSSTKILRLRYPEDPIEDTFCRYLDLVPASNGLPESLVIADVESSDARKDPCQQASYPGRPLCQVENTTQGLAITTSQVGRYFKSAPSASPTPLSLLVLLPISSSEPLMKEHIMMMPSSSSPPPPPTISRFETMESDASTSGASSTASFSFVIGFMSALALARMGF